MSLKEYEMIDKRICEYFISLGYVETMFEREVSLFNQYSNASRMDFVVKQSNKPYIVVEVKAAKTFVNLDNEELKYDPSVRQVQTYAMHSGAKYFVVTNGSDYLWFETGKDGRPQNIEPVFYDGRNSENEIGITVSEALNACRELLKSDSIASDSMYELVLILLARFAVRDQILFEINSNEINHILKTYYDFDICLMSRVTQGILENCWNVLSQCKPENADKKQLINTLKLLVQKSQTNYNFRFNEKLVEFLIRLAKPKKGQIILDPVANLGEITIAIANQNNQKQVYSYCQSPEQYAFLALLNVIKYNDIRNVSLISFQNFVLNSVNRVAKLKPDLMISAFQFGNRFNNLVELRNRMPIDINNIEDYMLLSSLELLNENGRLVAVVPDNMLFAGGKRERLRKYLVERYFLRSVISLPVGAITNTNAKMSIIVIDKTKVKGGNTFFGVVDSDHFSKKNLFLDDNYNSIGMLKAYEDYLTYNLVESDTFWKTFIVDMNVENLRVDTFLSINDSNMESQYPLYQLKDVCLSIRRGTAIKIDNDGNIPFLGPAAIRANSIDDTKASFTSEHNIKNSILYVEKGTVVINNISSYLGAAAIIESEQPIAINQHLIALVPNSDRLISQYLAIAINNKNVNDSILRASTGTTIPSITLENLKDICIPVPDLETQQKIVNAVNKIQVELAKLEEYKNELERKLSAVINSLETEEV